MSRKRYSEEDLIEAFAEVKKGSSIRGAALRYNVPKSTLFDVLSGKYALGKHKPG